MRVAALVLAAVTLGCGATKAPAEPDASSSSTFLFPEAGPAGCREIARTVAFEPRLADVLVLFDRSGSMNAAFGDGSRYSVEAAILTDLVGAYEARIRFGVQTFPRKLGCGGAAACCADPPEVAPDFGNAQAVAEAITDAAPVDGHTPTAAALAVAKAHFAASPPDGADRFVLLSTDGVPNCDIEGRLAFDERDPSGWVAGPCRDALDAVDGLRATGVRVVVLAVGDGLERDIRGRPTCLDDLARRGGAARPFGDTAFYSAKNPAELEKALQRIFGALTTPSCQIRLQRPAEDPDLVAVFMGGVEQPYDPLGQEGWSWAEGERGRVIRVAGTACERLERFQVDSIEIRSGCPPCTDFAVCE